MNIEEGQKAMRRLVLFHRIFAILFIVFVILASIGGMALIREISATSQCIEVDDDKFAACHETAKR